MKQKLFIKNISYTLTSHLISFMISALVTFFVPKFLGVDSYGYFQLYVFFSSYIGFLHFGWADGLYLRFGGAYYEELDKHRMSGQFWGLVITEVVFSLILAFVAIKYVAPEEKTMVVLLTSVAIIIQLPRTMLQYVLQCTNRIKENALVVLLERIIYFILVIMVLLLHNYEFVPIIVADLIGKIVALIFAVYCCRDIVTTKPEQFKELILEAKINISVGIKLMISNIASMLIIGIIRFSIENQWDISTFGKVSLSLSISNMLMIFVNAVALVMFPMLRRDSEEKYGRIYNVINGLLEVGVFGFMIIYYPVISLLSIWLPQYAESLAYLAVLFPMCVFEGKNALLLATFMKTLRKEKNMLIINICTLLFSIVSTYITVYVLKDLNYVVVSIVFLVAFRAIAFELFLSRYLEIQAVKNISIEIIVVALFVIANWLVGGMIGFVMYTVIYCGFLVIRKQELMQIYKVLKR